MSLKSLRTLRSITKVILIDNYAVLHYDDARVGTDDGLERNRVACANIVTQGRILEREMDNFIRSRAREDIEPSLIAY